MSKRHLNYLYSTRTPAFTKQSTKASTWSLVKNAPSITANSKFAALISLLREHICVKVSGEPDMILKRSDICCGVRLAFSKHSTKVSWGLDPPGWFVFLLDPILVLLLSLTMLLFVLLLIILLLSTVYWLLHLKATQLLSSFKSDNPLNLLKSSMSNAFDCCCDCMVTLVVKTNTKAKSIVILIWL